MFGKKYFMPVLASAMLFGLGIYYFIFEMHTYWWIIFLSGAVLNAYIAWQIKSQEVE